MRQIHTYTIIFLLFTAFSKVEASAPPLFDWQKCLGGSAQDMPVKMIQSQNGCILMLGSTGSSDGDVTINHGSNDLWLSKTDSNGNILWQKTYGGSNIDIGTGIIELANGDLILSGYTASLDGDISTQHGNFDAWIIRTNSSGTILWEKTIGGSLVDLCYAMIKSNDGGILIGGGTYSNDGDISGAHGDQDFWLCKLDANGNIIWEKTLGGSGLDVCYSIGQNNSNEIVACGSTTSSDGDVYGQHGGTDFWVVKLNQYGTLIWNSCYGGSDQESAFTMSCAGTSQILISGYSKSTNGDVHQNAGYNDLWTILIDQNGNLINQKVLGGSGTDIAFTSLHTSDGGFLLAGGTTSQDGDISSSHGLEDIWLTKLDAQLNLEWEKSYGGSSNERPSSLLQTTDGGYLFCGYSYSNDGNVSGNHGSSDYWLVHLSCHTPSALFSTTYDSLCVGMSAGFHNDSRFASTYEWWSNGTPLSTQENASLSLNVSGAYNVSLIAHTCYASDTTTKLIYGITPPEFKVSKSAAYFCSGDSVQLIAPSGYTCEWNTGDNSTSIYVHSRGPFQVTVNFSGCPSTSENIYLGSYSKPQIELGPDTILCNSSTMLLSTGLSQGYTYQWQDGSSNPTLTVQLPGEYSVLVSNEFCSSSDSIHIDTVSCNLPVAAFSVSSQNVCEHSAISFQNTSVLSTACTWTFPGGNPSVSNQMNPVVTCNTPGNYSVILTVSNDQGTQTLMRWNYIVVHASPMKPIIDVNGFQLSSTPAESYQWLLNSTMITGANQNYLNANQDGFYQVRISDEYQCSATSDSVYVSITGIQHTSNASSISVYPNPNSGKCVCTISSVESGSIRIIDSNGNEILHRMPFTPSIDSKYEIDLNDYPSGLYFVEFNGTQKVHLSYRIQKL